MRGTRARQFIRLAAEAEIQRRVGVRDLVSNGLGKVSDAVADGEPFLGGCNVCINLFDRCPMVTTPSYLPRGTHRVLLTAARILVTMLRQAPIQSCLHVVVCERSHCWKTKDASTDPKGGTVQDCGKDVTKTSATGSAPTWRANHLVEASPGRHHPEISQARGFPE
jgi:hypothetical protein